MENANNFEWTIYLQKQAEYMMKDYSDLIEAANNLLLLRKSKIELIDKKTDIKLCKLSIKKT